MMYAVHSNPLNGLLGRSVPQNQEVFQPLGSLKTAVADKAVKSSVIPKPPVQWRKIAKPTAAQLKLLGSRAHSAGYGVHQERGC